MLEAPRPPMKSTAFGSARGSTLSIHWSVWPAGGPGSHASGSSADRRAKEAARLATVYNRSPCRTTVLGSGCASGVAKRSAHGVGMCSVVRQSACSTQPWWAA